MEMSLMTIPTVSLLHWKIWVSFKQVCLNNICAPLALISARFRGSRTTSRSSNCLLWLGYSSAQETSPHVVDGVGTLNHATNPSYPDTEPRMSRIKTRTGPSVSGSTVAKTHFSNQNKQVNPLFQKLNRP